MWISREAWIKERIGGGQSRVGAKGRLSTVAKWRKIQVNQLRLEMGSHKAEWETERCLVMMRSNEANAVRSQWSSVVRKGSSKVKNPECLKSWGHQISYGHVLHVKHSSGLMHLRAWVPSQWFYLWSLWCLAGSGGS